MATSATKFNVYDHVTQTILRELENGTVPWRAPWTGSIANTGLPMRVTGEAYRGINVLMLWVAGQVGGFGSQIWMTYRQAQELGGQVRKGQKSSTVIKYGTVEVKKDDPAADPDTRGYARAYRVFNADQIDGLPEEFVTQVDAPSDLGTQSDVALDTWFGALGVPIDISDSPEAYYRPSTDRIHMPPIATFETAARYYSVLAHEQVHATKAEHRLDRQHPGKSDERYAREEIVAELASVMVACRLGITPAFDQSAAYLDHWITLLNQDNRAIIRAASMAQAACDWMFEVAGEAPMHEIG